MLRGHTDEVWSIATSEPTQLIASVSKDGDLKLWRTEDKRAFDGYRRLPESLGVDGIQPLDHSRVLLLPPGQPPEVVDLERDSPPIPLPEMGSSTNVLGCFGTNTLCYWNGTHQILVGELHGVQFMQRGAISLESARRPTGFTYNPARQLLAWSEGTSSRSLYLASLASAGRRIELTNEVPGLVPLLFSHDGNYLAATKERDALRAWNVASGQIMVSINQNIGDACFAANGNVLVVAFRDRILYMARWSADGNVILAGPPWQAWRAPSWEKIEAAEAKEKAENQHPER